MVFLLQHEKKEKRICWQTIIPMKRKREEDLLANKVAKLSFPVDVFAHVIDYLEPSWYCRMSLICKITNEQCAKKHLVNFKASKICRLVRVNLLDTADKILQELNSEDAYYLACASYAENIHHPQLVNYFVTWFQNSDPAKRINTLTMRCHKRFDLALAVLDCGCEIAMPHLISFYEECKSYSFKEYMLANISADNFEQCLKVLYSNDNFGDVVQVCNKYDRRYLKRYISNMIKRTAQNGNVPLLYDLLKEYSLFPRIESKSEFTNNSGINFYHISKECLELLYDKNFIQHTKYDFELCYEHPALLLFFNDPNFNVKPLLCKLWENMIKNITNYNGEQIIKIVTHKRYFAPAVIIEKHLNAAIDFANSCDNDDDQFNTFDQPLLALLESSSYRDYFQKYCRDKVCQTCEDDGEYYKSRQKLLGLEK